MIYSVSVTARVAEVASTATVDAVDLDEMNIAEMGEVVNALRLEIRRGGDAMESLPMRHVPRMLRGPAVRRKVERPVAYGVGEEHHPGEYGMYAGPFPTLAEALDVVGRPDGRVVRFNADGTDDVLYRWDEGGGAWDLDARVLQ